MGKKPHKPTKTRLTKVAVIIELKLLLVKNKITLFGEAYCWLICFDCLDKWPSNYESVVLVINYLPVQTLLMRIIWCPW